MIARISTQICAETVRSRLRELGYSQIDLAGFVGRTPNTVWNWLDGRTSPSIDDLARIAEFLQRGMLDIVRRSCSDIDEHSEVARLAAKFAESIHYAHRTDHRRKVSLGMNERESQQISALTTLIRFVLLNNRDRFICAPWVLRGFAKRLDLNDSSNPQRVLHISTARDRGCTLKIGFGLREPVSDARDGERLPEERYEPRSMILHIASIHASPGCTSLTRHFGQGQTQLSRDSAGDVILPKSIYEDLPELIVWSESSPFEIHWSE